MEAARVAGEGDLARLALLATLAIEEAASRRGGPALVARWSDASEAELQKAMTDVLGDVDRGLWAGTIDGAVVGVALADGAPGSAGRLRLFFVEPEARGVGVGEALLGAVVGWLSERGCTAVDVTVLPGDRDTKQFFEGSGMVTRLLIMGRSL